MDRTAIIVMIFLGLSAAAEPDWSCDFEGDDCGIVNLDGMWARSTTSSGAGVLSANVSMSGIKGDMSIFAIPYNFTSPRGNLSFDYFFVGDGTVLLVTACQEHGGPALQLHATGSKPLDDSAEIPYFCANKMDVEIIFNATIGGVAPLIRLDNIQIFETPYTASNETTTVPAATMTSIKGIQTSTEMVTDGTRPTKEKSTTKEGTPSPQRGGKPWLIPVVATIAVLLVITLLVLIVVLGYRRRAERFRAMTSGTTCKGVNERVVEGLPVIDRKSNQAKSSKPDIEYYADLQDYPGNNKQGMSGDGSVNGKLKTSSSSPSAADAFKVQNGGNIMDGDLVGNPVYESGGAVPTEVKDDTSEFLVTNPLYEGPDYRKQDSAPSDDHADTPLRGDGTNMPNHEDLNESKEEDGGPNNVCYHKVRGNALYALVNK